MYDAKIFKLFSTFLIVFYNTLQKNTLKRLKIALKHNLFSEQILKNLFFSKKIIKHVL